MAKRVFFSFHYQDVSDFRANVVRNHWRTKPDRGSAGFFDSSIWESAKRTSDLAVKRLINTNLKNTSNTCVLIGTDTWKRRWVRYEILKSLSVSNHIFAVHINKIYCKNSGRKAYGLNPLDYLGYQYSGDGLRLLPIEKINSKWVYAKDIEPYKLRSAVGQQYTGRRYTLSQFYKTYCWVNDDGYNKFSGWVK